jgi:hypothetical protein
VHAVFAPSSQRVATEIKDDNNVSGPSVVAEREAIEQTPLPSWQAKHGASAAFSEQNLFAPRMESSSFAGTFEQTVSGSEELSFAAPAKTNKAGENDHLPALRHAEESLPATAPAKNAAAIDWSQPDRLQAQELRPSNMAIPPMPAEEKTTTPDSNRLAQPSSRSQAQALPSMISPQPEQQEPAVIALFSAPDRPAPRPPSQANQVNATTAKSALGSFSEAAQPSFTAVRSSPQAEGSPAREPKSLGREVSRGVMNDGSSEAQTFPTPDRRNQQTQTGKAEASAQSSGHERQAALPAHSPAATGRMRQGIAEISPVQPEAARWRGAINNQNILPREASLPKLTINRLDIQIINQPPPAQTQPTPRAQPRASAFDTTEGLDRHYLGRFYLSW